MMTAGYLSLVHQSAQKTVPGADESISWVALQLIFALCGFCI